MFEIKDSQIDGSGIIATEDIPAEQRIGVWMSQNYAPKSRRLVGDEWFENYPLGRYCNHSNSPNTRCEIIDGDVVLFSKGIQAGEEIFTDYWWCYNISGFKSSFLE